MNDGIRQLQTGNVSIPLIDPDQRQYRDFQFTGQLQQSRKVFRPDRIDHDQSKNVFLLKRSDFPEKSVIHVPAVSEAQGIIPDGFDRIRETDGLIGGQIVIETARNAGNNGEKPEGEFRRTEAGTIKNRLFRFPPHQIADDVQRERGLAQRWT